MKRAPELIAIAHNEEAEVADTKARHNRLAGATALIAAGVAMAWFLLAYEPAPPPDDIEDEEFTTTTFRPPSFVRDPQPNTPPPEPQTIEITPPAEEPADTTEFEVPPPPAASVPAQPPPEPVKEQAEAFPERYRSSQIVFDASAAGSEQRGASSGRGEGAGVAGEDRNSRFLAAAATLGDRMARARRIERIDALVPEGTLIPGILETAIVSDLPGQIRAIVSQDVYGFDGRRVLIPAGTRLIGEYQSDVIAGQRRIFVIWTRMLRDDGVSVRLDSIGADSLGRSGLAGHVDKKFRERFGAAILLSIVGGAAGYLTGQGSANVGEASGEPSRAEELARATIAQTFADMANQVLGENLKIAPTISVGQGERIFVYVRQDLDFSGLYEDPVSEALREIRRERGLR